MRQRLKKGSKEPTVLEDVSDESGSGSGTGSESESESESESDDDDKISRGKGSVRVTKGVAGKMTGKGKKATPPAGYNWSAVAILVLFMAIPLFTGFQYVYDYINPVAAQSRQVHSNLYRCYNAIGDQEKIAKIDYYVNKYKGKERKCDPLSSPLLFSTFPSTLPPSFILFSLIFPCYFSLPAYPLSFAYYF